jgi:hypothetical protein
MDANTINAAGNVINSNNVLGTAAVILSLVLGVIQFIDFLDKRPKLKIRVRAFLRLNNYPRYRQTDKTKYENNINIMINFIVTNIASKDNSVIAIKYMLKEEKKYILERSSQYVLDSLAHINSFMLQLFERKIINGTELGIDLSIDEKEIFKTGTTIRSGESKIITDVIECKVSKPDEITSVIEVILNKRLIIELEDAYGKKHKLENVPEKGAFFSDVMK